MSCTSLERKLDAIMEEFVSPDGPGAAVLIARDTQVLVRKAYGLANVSRREPLTPEHRFIMASVTKQFTCLCVMVLKDRGLLSYDETIGRFFPDYPAWKDRVTVRHLMNQTSGLQEYLTKAFWGAVAEAGNSIDLDGLLKMIGTFEELEFAPGSRWRYCNTNYILLGSIIEKVSGMPFRAFMQETILHPLEMKDSFAGDSGEAPPRQATGYSVKGKAEVRAEPYNREVVGWADGNLISTVDDMFLWAQSLSTDAVLPLGKKSQACVPWNPLNTAETRYGFGQMIGERRGVREVHHGGGTLGFNTKLARFPDEKLTVIVLSNASGIGVDQILGAIAEELLGDKMVPIAPVTLPEEHLKEKVARYTGRPRDDVMTLDIAYSAAAGNLTAERVQDEPSNPPQRTELVPLGRDLFLMDKRTDKYLMFIRENGGVSGLRIYSLGSVMSLPVRLG